MGLELQKWVDRIFGDLLLVALKPLVVLLGLFLRRDHRLDVRGRVTLIKMLGGGSLVIALPALLGLRRRYPKIPIALVTTTAIAPFARTLGVFDEVLEIETRGPLRLAYTAARALAKSFRSDAFLDLEVYSRLTTVFSVLTCSRNRLGFYLESVLWRRPIHTHLIFFNRRAQVALFYERMTGLLGAEPVDREECAESVRKAIDLELAPRHGEHYQVAIGAGCSDLSRERMLSPEQWLAVFKKRLAAEPRLRQAEFHFLGGRGDAAVSAKTLALLREEFPGLRAIESCGKLKLPGSLRALAGADEFWGIDSALLHYARLFGLTTVSFWGPTSPEALLKPFRIREEVHYESIPCSPCVHVAEFPPCAGRNVCMSVLLEPLSKEELAKRLPVIVGSAWGNRAPLP
jgi:ADP-heptose:LPS heptosyltransferase